MKVLFLAARGCRPPNTGTRLRNYHLCRQMARTEDVTYLSFGDDPSVPFSDERGEQCAELAQRVITVPKAGGISPLKVAQGMVGRLPFTILNYTTPAMQVQLARLLREEQFDVVQVEGMVLAGYLPILMTAKPKPLLVCDWHNVDSELMSRYAEHAPDALRSRYARLTAGRIAASERYATPRFDAHLTVSDRDRDFLHTLQKGVKAYTVENGTTLTGLEPEPGMASNRHRILFVGSMDYHPNNDAALYFAAQVWPLIQSQRPDWTFTIVGRDPSPAVRALAGQPGIEVTGTVPDVRPYYHEALASVVPLRIGGGSRLKILESMAARVPIVSTSLGAEGLEVRDGETILLRDTPGEMAQALLNLEHDERVPHMLEAGRALAIARYDWSAIGVKLRGIYDELLPSKSVSPAASSR